MLRLRSGDTTQTRKHSSRMRTARCSGRPWGGNVSLGGVSARGVFAKGVSAPVDRQTPVKT